jgi:hypothetical protein
MSTRSRNTRRLVLAGVVLASLAPAAVAAADHRDHEPDGPRLEGRAVLPVDVVADGPISGKSIASANGYTFPVAGQPVEGFSGIVEGDEPGEWLAMADNGYGGKAVSTDFNLRAYTIRPDFKTAQGGTGAVDVIDWIEFRDPRHMFPYKIVNEGKPGRVLTGGDIDPESIQRGRDGTLWVGDEFGPWILHFDAQGRLLEAPYPLPGNLKSPNNPTLNGQAPTVLNSGGFEAMAMSPNGRSLYAVLEKALPQDPAGTRRVYEFDVRARQFTGVVATYPIEPATADGILVADAQMLDNRHMLLIERDGGRGETAVYRKVFEVDLRDHAADGTLNKQVVVDLAAIPDPDLVSLPPIHTGDVGLGNPFKVTCESIEALRIVDDRHLLLGCDNNLPNTGRNPGRADDNEFITVTL